MSSSSSSNVSVIHTPLLQVPSYIRNVDCNAYEPQIIYIGPYHRDRAGFETMQEHKRQYQDHLLQRNCSTLKAIDIIDDVKSLENEIVQYYSTKIRNQDFFWEEMVLDCCFLIELLLKLWEYRDAEKPKKPSCRPSDTPSGHSFAAAETEMKPSFNTPSRIMKPLSTMMGMHKLPSGGQHTPHSANMGATTSLPNEGNQIHSKFVLLLPQITLDLLLLENQIPFVILDRVFTLTTVPGGENYPHSLVALATEFFKSFIKISPEVSTSEPIHHLLHLFHNCLVLEQSRKRKLPHRHLHHQKQQQVPDKQQQEVLDKEFVKSALSHILLSTACTPSANELVQAGIELRKDSRWFYRTKADNFMDVKYADRVLDLAPLAGPAYPILRNLVAFEHINPSSGSHVTAYAYLLSALVKSTEDVKLLRNKKIIPDWVGTEMAVMEKLNRLCEGVVIFEFGGYIWDVIAKINAFCDRKPNRLETFMQNYFKDPFESLTTEYLSNPWRTLAVIGGIVILILTLLQVIFAVLQYTHDLKPRAPTPSPSYSKS